MREEEQRKDAKALRRKEIGKYRCIALPLCVLLFIGGCNFAPKYTRSDSGMPTSWRVETNDLSTMANTKWWEGFQDEVLNTLVQRALENNKDLAVAVWRVKEYQGQYMVARSPLFPEIDFKSDAFRQRYSESSALSIPGFGPVFSDYGASVGLSYELDFWGQLRNASTAGYQEYLAQIENRKTVVLSLVGKVAEAYIYLRQLDLEMYISQETLESRRDSLRIARARFEGGLTSEIEVAQAESLFEEALATVKELERRIPQQENLLSVLLGENSALIARGKRLDELTLLQEIPSGLPSDLLTRRPDIAGAENVLLAANANIGVARAAFFPTINLMSFYGTDTQQIKDLFSLPAQTWQFGGNLLQLIFTGGRLTGQLKMAEAKQKEALFRYEQTILTALKEVNDSLIGHKKAKEIVLVDKAEVEALQEYLDLSWLRYYEGQTQYLTVLDAERSLFSGQITLVKAIGDQFLTLVSLYKALGGGWVEGADALVVESSLKEE